MLNDHIPSGINNKSESTSRTPVLSIDDTFFWQKPALSVFFFLQGPETEEVFLTNKLQYVYIFCCFYPLDEKTVTWCTLKKPNLLKTG